MTYRNLILAACVSTGISVAFGSLAMPLDTLKTKAASAVELARYHESEDDDHGHQSSNDCGGDDGDGTCGGRSGAVQQQNATPPANGLFMPGSKPQVQTN